MAVAGLKIFRGKIIKKISRNLHEKPDFNACNPWICQLIGIEVVYEPEER